MKKIYFLSVFYILNFYKPTFADELPIPSQAIMPLTTSKFIANQTLDISLHDAIFIGLRDNRTIRSAFLQRIAQKFDLKVAENQFMPKLVLNALYLKGQNQQNQYNTTDIFPSTTLLSELGTRFSLSWANRVNQTNLLGGYLNNGINFTVIQPLLRDAGTEVTTAPLRIARLNEQSNLLNLKYTVTQTITQIALSYRELLRAQEQLRIVNDAMTRSQQLIEVNKALIVAGRMADFEIIQTQADLATQELAVEEATNNLDSSRRELLHLLSLDLNYQIYANDLLEAKKINIDKEHALHIAFENQPQYLIQLISNEQAKINLVLAKNQRLWDISIIGGVSHFQTTNTGVQNSELDKQWDQYAGIQVNIPIGDIQSRQNEVRAKVDLEDKEIKLTEIKQLLEREIGDAVRNTHTRWRQYEIAKKARNLSLQKLEIEKKKLQVGRSSNFQVLSFEADMRSAENAQLNALITYLNTQTLLDEKLGMTLESWDITLND